jgi:hypothetical protein
VLNGREKRWIIVALSENSVIVSPAPLGDVKRADNDVQPRSTAKPQCI